MRMQQKVQVATLVVGLSWGWVVASPLAFADDPAENAVNNGKRFVTFDIQPRANKKLDDDFHSYPGNNLKLLPRGKQTMGDVDFDIGEKFVQLAGKRAPDYPEIVKGFRVNRHLTNLHFLHGAGWVVSDGTPLGEYVIHYDDGTDVKRPIEYGRDVRDWWMYEFDQGETPRAVIAWKGLNHASKNFQDSRISIRLYRMTWENPHPEKKVLSFDYVSKNETICSPFLVAASGEPTADDEDVTDVEPVREPGTPSTKKPRVANPPMSTEVIAAIDKLRDFGALLEFDDEGQLQSVALAGPGQRQGETRGTNESVALVTGISTIEQLDLTNSSVSDSGLDAIKSLANLRWLSLNYVAISDEGLQRLKRLKSLERLRLHQTRITDEGLSNLIGLTKLKILDLSHTGITDAGLENLEPLSSLEELDLRNTKVTQAGVAALQKRLPAANILR